MVAVKRMPGTLMIRMCQVVGYDDIQTIRTDAGRYLMEEGVQSLVVDIRGCKPIDNSSCDLLKGLLVEAREHGVRRFVRVGDGTLLALQVNALEQMAQVSDRTMIVANEAGLRRWGLESHWP